MRMTMRFAGGQPRNPETDELVAALAGPARADAERLLRIFREELPEAAEAIRWNNPMWFVDGVCAVFLMTFPNHVNLGLGDGATLDDPDGVIEGAGGSMRHIKLKSATEPSDSLLRRYVRIAAAQAKRIAATGAGRSKAAPDRVTRKKAPTSEPSPRKGAAKVSRGGSKRSLPKESPKRATRRAATPKGTAREKRPSRSRMTKR